MKGLIFDKDGTLFDFNATWGAWARTILVQESQGDLTRLDTLARVLGYDLAASCFLPGSIVIAETVAVLADHMVAHLPDDDVDALIARLNTAAGQVPQVAAADLPVVLGHLRGQGCLLGVATNDAESSALAHLDRAGVTHLFDFIAGFDSGHGAKPGAGQLLGFCTRTGLDPSDCAMIGDSTHDLNAGRAAGMTTIGVLTGPAKRAELLPLADVVLASIADLPGWLKSR